MGIPSYFSFIVKNHPEIIKKLQPGLFNINNLYLDSNSIIYEIYHKLDAKTIVHPNSMTKEIIKRVIAKIETYVAITNPKDCIYIAFDGVAPLAKMEQQRSRRYKSAYQTQVIRKMNKNVEPDPWNTAAITPGTKFMYDLTVAMKAHFANPNEFKVQKIIVSSSDEHGEGEHKLFEHIRNNEEMHNEDKNPEVYGLDADLIMLAINHLRVCPNLYLFREAPHFVQSIDSRLEPDEHYILDIPQLANSIAHYMSKNNNDSGGGGGGAQANISQITWQNKLSDYIFMGIMLGNDFMPHFPSLNIRTGGIDKLLNAYRAVIAPAESLTVNHGTTILWIQVRKLFKFLADIEQKYIAEEYNLRNKRQHYNRHSKDSPEEDAVRKFEALPTYEREIEHYINPTKDHWQSRYYRSLLQIVSDDGDGLRKKAVCVNYLQGLEWTMRYYSKGCPDWRWKYNYMYPPLLTDLLEYTPVFKTSFVSQQPSNPVSAIVQLCYVLPKESLDLIPHRLRDRLLQDHPNWYKSDCEFMWAFCRYFWESHVLLHDIDIVELEEFIMQHKELMFQINFTPRN